MNDRGFLNESDRIHHFLTLLGTELTEENFQRCLEQLDGYVTAQLDGDPYLEKFSDIAVLLDAHPDCVEAYALLYEMITAEHSQTLTQPSHIPPPNLSFLRKQAPSLLSQLTAALQQTADSLTLTLNQALLRLLQPPASTPALALRTAPSERYGQKLFQLEPSTVPALNIPFTLAAYQDSQQPDHSLIEITVQPPGKSWPKLAGYRVSLRYADQSQQATTDAWGVVSFQDIPTAQLTNLIIIINIAS